MTDTTITPINPDAAVKAVRYAVRARGTWLAYVNDNGVTRETVKDHALALAILAYPNDAQVQKQDGQRTRFGNAVQAAGNGMRSVLDKDETTKNTDWLKLVKQAAANAHNKGEIPTDQIVAAVMDALKADLTAVA